MQEQRFWNPYLAGVALGLVLLASFLVMGQGLGASGAVFRYGVGLLHAVAPAHVESNPHMGAMVAGGQSPLDNYFTYMTIGVLLGGAVSSYAAGRMRLGVRKGPRTTLGWRLTFAFGGGLLMGYAAKLARGCTSGQALSGGAMLSVGAWIFMLAVFAGGYGMAWFVRRQWT
jgi:hypothetical protein